MVDGVEVREDSNYNDLKRITLENELIRVTVFPELGAKIYDLVYKPSGKNVLWHNPRIRPRRVPFGVRFDDVWCGGWDEIFPNDAPSIVDGENYPDMGEIWSIEWDHAITRENNQSPGEAATLVTSTQSPISPSNVTRYLTLRRNEAALHMRYVFENIGFSPLRFLWKLHPAFDINETCTIELPAKTALIDSRYRSLYSSQKYAWPWAMRRNGERVNVSQVAASTDRTCSLHYVTGLEEGVVTVRNPRDKLDVKISFPKNVMECVWLFLAYGGWRSLYTAVIEPSTSYPYDLAEAIKKGHFSALDPGQTLDCKVDVELISQGRN